MTILKNDQLEAWDRSCFFHPSTHLAQFARGEAVTAAEIEPERAARQEFYLHLFDPPAYHRLCWRLATGEAVAVEAELHRRGLDPHATSPDPGREREYLDAVLSRLARAYGSGRSGPEEVAA